MKYWESIADNLSKAGWGWGCVSALNCEGRTICIADAHRADGKRFVVRQTKADHSALLGLPSRIKAFSQPFDVILPVNDWAIILPSRTTNVSVPNSYTLSAVSALHRM
jgi:hypothetical protein